MSLDKLREIDAAASPGPWRVEHGPYDVWGGDGAWFGILHASSQLDMGDGSIIPGQEELRKANAKLASLSHLLLPAMEALHGSITPEGHTRGCNCAAKWCQDREAVLAQLEEALADASH